jgi:Zn-dependent M28 family amino/carboxypeptidase
MIVAVNAGMLPATRQEPRVERAEVERIVRTLASDDMEGRSALGNAIERAAAFIGSEFEAIGLQPLPEQTGFLQRFEADVRGRSAQMANVVGMIPGRRSNEFVLFSAHYDHVGFQPGRAVDGDSIANGANDNASGTTAVISLARYFQALGQPERTLLFAAFTAEEIGGFGSRYFSNQLDPDEIVAMFNIEMIGKPAREGPNTAWITGFDRSDFGQILQRAVRGTQYEFYADPYPDQNLFFRSDNATLARLGVPAHSISTTPIDVDTDYHRVTDEVETLDLDHMTNTIRAIAAGARTIVSGAETPIRVTDVSR